MPEIGTSGLMSGDGKRGGGQRQCSRPSSTLPNNLLRRAIGPHLLRCAGSASWTRYGPAGAGLRAPCSSDPLIAPGYGRAEKSGLAGVQYTPNRPRLRGKTEVKKTQRTANCAKKIRYFFAFLADLSAFARNQTFFCGRTMPPGRP